MSDPLAEHIYQAAFDRHVPIDRTDCAALAAAARAFIGGELHAFGEQHSIGAYGIYGPPAIALSDAESIARGDTE